MKRIACIILLLAIGSQRAYSAEKATPNSRRLRVRIDEKGVIEIDGAVTSKKAARKTSEKLIIFCDRLRIEQAKKAKSSVQATFSGSVRAFAGHTAIESNTMTLSLPDGVKRLLKIGRTRNISRKRFLRVK